MTKKPWSVGLLVGALTAAMGAAPALAQNGHPADMALDVLADKVTITPAQAVKAAKAQVQGRVKEVCLKAFGDQPVYEVEFENDREVWVNARTGKVMRVK